MYSRAIPGSVLRGYSQWCLEGLAVMGIEPMSTTRKACAQPIDASLASMKDSFTIGEYTGEDNSCIFHIICMHIICIFVY